MNLIIAVEKNLMGTDVIMENVFNYFFEKLYKVAISCDYPKCDFVSSIWKENTYMHFPSDCFAVNDLFRFYLQKNGFCF